MRPKHLQFKTWGTCHKTKWQQPLTKNLHLLCRSFQDTLSTPAREHILPIEILVPKSKNRSEGSDRTGIWYEPSHPLFACNQGHRNIRDLLTLKAVRVRSSFFQDFPLGQVLGWWHFLNWFDLTNFVHLQKMDPECYPARNCWQMLKKLANVEELSETQKLEWIEFCYVFKC